MKFFLKAFFALSLVGMQSMYADEVAAGANEVKAEEVATVFELKVTDMEGQIIEEIVTTMGKTNVIALGFKQGHLKSLGGKLHKVGAMQFLAYIFTKQELKIYMQGIRKSSFKWNGFMGGLISGLNKETDTGELLVNLPSFANSVQSPYELLLVKAKERDWHGFVTILIKS